MHYQGKEGEGSFQAGWNQMINTLLVLAPTLFGCSRVPFKDVANQRELDNLMVVLQKLGGAKVAEAHSPAGDRHHYFFRVQKRPVALLVEEKQPVRVIAPQPVIDYLQNERKIVL